MYRKKFNSSGGPIGRPSKHEKALKNFAATALNKSDYDKLMTICDETGKTKSDVLREAVIEYCKKCEE